MRGKVGVVIGLAAGYVLGSRAGRERYEQIKAQWLKLWHLDPVQQRVEKVKDFVKSGALALPGAVWTGAVKVTQAATTKGTPGQKLDAALKVGKESADDISTAAHTSAHAVEDAAEKVKDAVEDAVDDVRDRGGA